jgi:hypothetical protein
MKTALVIVASLTLLTGAVSVAQAQTTSQPSSPVSTTEGVTPHVLRNADGSLIGPGGNVRCDQVGTFDYASDRTDYEPESPGEDFTVIVANVATGAPVGTAKVTYYPGTKRLDIEATLPIEAVIVRGGDDANIYDYRPDGMMFDTGLGAPPNASGGSSDLGNITLCSNPHEEPPPSSWCSPGYWRQPHHLPSWTPTGISPDALYLGFFSATTLSKKAPKNANPTLWDVLQSPQTYGGTAFNNVGDLLSDAHPDVFWSEGDDRTEDSCPLS